MGWGATYCSDNERGHTLTSCIAKRRKRRGQKTGEKYHISHICGENEKVFFEYILRNVWGMQGELTVCVVAVPKTDRCTQNPIALIKVDTRCRSSAKKKRKKGNLPRICSPHDFRFVAAVAH